MMPPAGSSVLRVPEVRPDQGEARYPNGLVCGIVGLRSREVKREIDLSGMF